MCEGDKVIVEVENHLASSGVTLHWHGLTMEENKYGAASPHFDGVPGITQCDIPTRGTFTYKFTADVAGTYWWHSHSGVFNN